MFRLLIHEGYLVGIVKPETEISKTVLANMCNYVEGIDRQIDVVGINYEPRSMSFREHKPGSIRHRLTLHDIVSGKVALIDTYFVNCETFRTDVDDGREVLKVQTPLMYFVVRDEQFTRTEILNLA